MLNSKLGFTQEILQNLEQKLPQMHQEDLY